jgi:manganese-dependent ADP-ribose/CDP-alcohol diphosphatase
MFDFIGAISEEQLKWIEEELEESDIKNELVIVFGHVGLHPESCNSDCLIWNYEEVIACFNRHPSVIAYLCGHSHNHGYAYANGIHYLVFQAIIETPPDQQSFATITVYEDRIEVEGHGIEQSRVLSLNNRRQLIIENEVINDIIEELNDEVLEETPTIQVEV